MKSSRKSFGVDRREFLAATGTGLLAASMPNVVKGGTSSALGALSNSATEFAAQASPGSLRKIPIGVFDPVYENLSLDEMLDRVSALGLEAMEIGTGRLSWHRHCPIDELLADAGKAKHGKKFEDHGIHVATLSCHGNPVHPDEKHAAHDRESFRKTVLLAEAAGCASDCGIFRVPGRHANRHSAELDHISLASGIRGDAGLAVGKKSSPVLEGSCEIRARARRTSHCAGDASEFCCL